MGKNSEKRGNGMGTQVEKLDVGVEGRKWKRQADASATWTSGHLLLSTNPLSLVWLLSSPPIDEESKSWNIKLVVPGHKTTWYLSWKSGLRLSVSKAHCFPIILHKHPKGWRGGERFSPLRWERRGCGWRRKGKERAEWGSLSSAVKEDRKRHLWEWYSALGH